MWRDIIIIFLTTFVFMLSIALYLFYKNLDWYKQEKAKKLEEREKNVSNCEQCQTDLSSLKNTHSAIKDLVSLSS